MNKILLEGKYDSITRQISNDILEYIKKTEGITDKSEYFSLPFKKNNKDTYAGPNLSIGVELSVYRTNNDIEYGDKKIPYYINTFIDDENYLVMDVMIDDRYGKKYYEKMFYKINEDVRHELEHFLQNTLSDRQKPNIENTSDYTSTFEHHTDPSEVEALVHGYYRKSKLEKKPLNVIMMDDLNYEISLGNITKEESNKLLNTWITYARRRLPNAIYSF